MHLLILSFNLLLASILLSLSLVQGVPLKRNTGLITLPLKRIHQARDDLHPLVFHQLHLNRGHKRLALMTGREQPTVEQLSMPLRRAIEDAANTKRFNRPVITSPQKRFNRDGIPKRAQPDNTDEITSVIDHLGQHGVTGLEIGNEGELTTSQGGASAGNDTTAVAPPDQIGGGAALTAVSDGRLIAANNPTANNTLGLHLEIGDVGYSATIQIGTPPKPFLILMDSGSADFWVGSESCQSIEGGGCGNHQFLGPESSSSFQDSNVPWNITYGTGSASGTVIKDNVFIGNLQLTGHEFGATLLESIEFSSQNTPFDGLMGLARSELSNQGVLSPIEALKAQGLVSEAITSYKISRGADKLNDGEITFGGLDQSKFNPQTLVTVPNVNRQGFWEASMPSITVNGQDIGLRNRSAILDTGTTLIIAPPADAEALHQAIPGATSNEQGQFTVPCNTAARLAFTFGGKQFEIDPRDLAFLPLGPGSPDCISGISTSRNFGFVNEWLVGDVFLKNAYFSHNVDKNSISLAELT